MKRSVLVGEYEFTLDVKSRVAIPARLRHAFVDGIFVTRGYERCISGYAPAEWERFVAEQIQSTPEMSSKGRMLRRRTLASANLLELDAQGRIKLPSSLLEYASIVRDVTIIGVEDRIEFWDRNRWAQYLKQSEEEADAAADELATP